MSSVNGPQTLQEVQMGKKLYIGNLSYSVDDQSLADLFSQYGNVESARIITDRDSGRSKGFAFVEMDSDDAAATAIEKLHGTEFSGRNLNVSEAKPMAPRENRGGGGGGGRRNFGGGGGGGGRSRY